MQKKVELNLDDLRVESFETLPEITINEMTQIAGACDTSTCYTVCSSGCKTTVCVAPSGQVDEM